MSPTDPDAMADPHDPAPVPARAPGSAPVGLVTHPACAEHDPGPGHPESPARLRAVLGRLGDAGLRAGLDDLEAPAAELDDLARVHERAYLERVRDAFAAGRTWVDSPDANGGPATWEATRRAAGGVLAAVERVLDGRWRAAFCAVRPPGHHAEEGLAMGFCFANHVALAAARARDAGLERVAIVDWDVHHGNGTQHLFEADPTVFYASLHQSPHYPGTGAATERGRGDGEGATLNLPQAAGSGEREWLGAFEDRLLPALDAFRPELVLVSAGFDAHRLDPLSDTRLEAAHYARMTELLRGLADRHAGGRLVSLLEGGYSLEGLADSAEAHVAALLAP